jgi:hypothetical protein
MYLQSRTAAGARRNAFDRTTTLRRSAPFSLLAPPWLLPASEWPSVRPHPLDNDNGQFGQTYVYRWDGGTLVFDLHLSGITGSTLSMSARRLAVGISTNDSHGNPVEGAIAIDFGDRSPADDEND